MFHILPSKCTKMGSNLQIKRQRSKFNLQSWALVTFTLTCICIWRLKQFANAIDIAYKSYFLPDRYSLFEKSSTYMINENGMVEKKWFTYWLCFIFFPLWQMNCNSIISSLQKYCKDSLKLSVILLLRMTLWNKVSFSEASIRSCLLNHCILTSACILFEKDYITLDDVIYDFLITFLHSSKISRPCI